MQLGRVWGTAKYSRALSREAHEKSRASCDTRLSAFDPGVRQGFFAPLDEDAGAGRAGSARGGAA